MCNKLQTFWYCFIFYIGFILITYLFDAYIYLCYGRQMKWFINYLGASTILNLEGQKINFLLLTANPFIKNPYQRVHKMTGPLSLGVRYIKFLMIHFASCAFKINIKKYFLIVIICIRFYINVYYLLKMCLNLLLFW